MSDVSDEKSPNTKNCEYVIVCPSKDGTYDISIYPTPHTNWVAYKKVLFSCLNHQASSSFVMSETKKTKFLICLSEKIIVFVLILFFNRNLWTFLHHVISVPYAMPPPRF